MKSVFSTILMPFFKAISTLGRSLRRNLVKMGAVCVVVGCCTSCSGPGKDVDLTLLYVTDVHGLLLPQALGTSEMPNSSMANFSTYVNYIHNTQGEDNTVLLCGGNLNDELPLLYYYNRIARFDEHISPSVMNYLGFDAIQLGASDMSLGMDVWIGILPAQYKMPYMCANLQDNKTDIPPFRPYTIVERHGVRIAVIGLIDPKSCENLGPEDIQGLHIGNLVDLARYSVNYIKEYEKPDYTIVMASAGADNEEFLKIAGVDLFLLGADHKSLPPNEYRMNEAGDSVLLVQPLPNMAECARIDLHLHKGILKNEVKAVDVQRVQLSQLEPDTAFVNHFKPQERAVSDYLDTSLGNILRPLRYSEALFGPSLWLDVKHDMQLWCTGADISICNIGSEVGDLDAGTFTMRDLFHFIDIDHKMWVVPMSGEEIHLFLEATAAAQYNQMTSASDHLLAFKYNDLDEVIIGADGPVLVQDKDQFCSAAGIRYTIDVSKPAGERVHIQSLSDGSPFSMSATYRVAMSDFLALGGGGYAASLNWDKSTALRRLDFSGTLSLRTHFINFVKAHKNYNPVSRSDWKVIPYAYFEAGSKRDYQLMKRYIQ